MRDGCELAQHKLLAPTCQAFNTTTPASATSKWGFMNASGKPHRFNWDTKRVRDLTVQTGAISYAPGQWLSMETAGANVPAGQIKTFGLSDFSAAAICVAGVNYVDVEFRSRK